MSATPKVLTITLALGLSQSLNIVSAIAAPIEEPAKKIIASAPQLTHILSALSTSTGKPVLWLGAPPSPQSRLLASQPSINSIETIGEWATRWASAQNMVVETSPEAVVFRSPKLVTNTSGATATSNFIQTEKLQLGLMEAIPSSILARMPHWETSRLAQGYDIDASHETVPLAVIKSASPNFETRLRAFLKIFHTRVQGERELNGQTFKYDMALEDVPAERLRIGLTANTDALCRIQNSKLILRLPVNQPCSPAGCYVASPSAPLIKNLKQPIDVSRSQIFQGKLGALLSPSKPSKTRLVIASNLQNIPVVMASPRELSTIELKQIAEKAIGLQHRRVGDLEYLTIANDDFTNRTHTLIDRWQMAHGTSPFSYFQAGFNRPRWVKIANLDWPARWALINEFRQWQLENPDLAKTTTEAQLLRNGEVWFARAATLHLLIVEPATTQHPLIPLKHYPISLHGSTPPN